MIPAYFLYLSALFFGPQLLLAPKKTLFLNPVLLPLIYRADKQISHLVDVSRLRSIAMASTCEPMKPPSSVSHRLADHLAPARHNRALKKMRGLGLHLCDRHKQAHN